MKYNLSDIERRSVAHGAKPGTMMSGGNSQESFVFEVDEDRVSFASLMYHVESDTFSAWVDGGTTPIWEQR